MKKSFWARVLLILTLCLSFALPGFCLKIPTITYEEFQLGNIKPGTALTAVVTEFGQPDSQGSFVHKSYGKKFKGVTYIYHNGLSVSALPTRIKGVSTVISVACTRSGLATPSGFEVGKPFSLVTDKYGPADQIPKEALATAQKLEAAQGYSFYIYTYGPSVMSFKVDPAGLIQELDWMMGA